MVKYILIKYINTKKQTISQTPGMRRAPSLLSLLSDVSCRCNDRVYRISGGSSIQWWQHTRCHTGHAILRPIWDCGQWSLTGDPVTLPPGPGLQTILRHQTEVPSFNYFKFLFCLLLMLLSCMQGLPLIEFLPENRHCVAYSGHLTLPSSVMSL